MARADLWRLVAYFTSTHRPRAMQGPSAIRRPHVPRSPGSYPPPRSGFSRRARPAVTTRYLSVPVRIGRDWGAASCAQARRCSRGRGVGGPDGRGMRPGVRRASQASRPGPGFIPRLSTTRHSLEKWPRSLHPELKPPDHSSGARGGVVPAAEKDEGGATRWRCSVPGVAGSSLSAALRQHGRERRRAISADTCIG